MSIQLIVLSTLLYTLYKLYLMNKANTKLETEVGQKLSSIKTIKIITAILILLETAALTIDFVDQNYTQTNTHLFQMTLWIIGNLCMATKLNSIRISIEKFIRYSNEVMKKS